MNSSDSIIAIPPIYRRFALNLTISPSPPLQGPGTQIRRGQRINTFPSIGSTDRTRVEALLRGARPVASPASSPSSAAAAAPSHSSGAHSSPLLPPDENIEAVIAADDYSGVVIITKHSPSSSSASVPTIAAFALSPLAYAEGTEAALWKAVKGAYASRGLVWVAPAGLPLPDAAAAAKAGGPRSLPSLFPPLSAARSTPHASATVVVEGGAGGGSVACYWGPAGVEGAAAAAAAVAGAVQGGAAGAASGGSPPSVKPSASVAAASPILRSPTTSSATPTAVAAAAAVGGGVGGVGGGMLRGRGIRVGLLGARGFVGRELVRLIAGE